MAEKQFTVIDEAGIHARPASALVSTANNFKSDISLVYNGKDVNLKSVLGIMSLGIANGANISIRAEGEDAEVALTAIEETLQKEGLAK